MLINSGVIIVRITMLALLGILLNRADVTTEEFVVTLGLAGALSLFSYVHGRIDCKLT